MANTVPIRMAVATITNRPTSACWLLGFMIPFPAPGLSGATVFRQRLPIVEFASAFRFSDTTEKLADARLRAGAHLFGCSDSNDITLVDQDHAIGDQVGASELVSDHNDGHTKSLL